MSSAPHPTSSADGAEKSPRRPRLAVEVAIVLAVKFAALVAIWSVWFDEPQDRHIDGDEIARAIYAAPAVEAPPATTNAARP